MTLGYMELSRRGIGAIVLLVLVLAFAPAVEAQTGVQFDGTNDYVTFGQALGAGGLGVTTFTLELWFYRTGTGVTTSTGTGGVTAIPLFTKGRGEADGSTKDMNFFLGIRGTDNVLCADYEEGTGQTSPGLNHPVYGVTAIRNNTWYHAAATFDGTTWRLYLNGLLETELVVGASRLPQNNSEQHAGLATAMTSAGATAGFFAGVIDEPRIWNIARAQQEIRDNMGLEVTSGTGLIGRWGLNEGTGTTAANSISGGVSGTLTNGPTWVTGTPFVVLSSLKLGSSSAYVTFGNVAGLGLPQFTLETWFRRDGTGTAVSTGSGGVTAIPLVTKGGAEQDGSNVDMNYFLGIRSSDNVLAADFEEGAGGSSPGLNHPIVGVTPITTGQWYHAAATYDGATWKLYLNGNLENELTVGQPPRSDSIQHSGLGTCLTSTGTASGFFNGTLDEVRIWNYARSLAQVDSTINDQITTTKPGLAARWGLNEGAMNKIYNSAGTTITGTVTGTGWSWDATAPFDIVIGPPQPPVAPSNLTATAISYAEIDLVWTDNSNNETSFEIERSTTGSGGPFSALATVNANVTSYKNHPLAVTTEYCYRVRAVNNAGASDWTTAACATTLAEAATALDFTGTNGYVTFGQAPSLGLAQFTLECWFRRDGAGTTANTGTGGVLAVPLVTKGVGEAEGSNVDMNYFLGIRGTDGVLAADFEEGVGGTTLGLNHPVIGVTPVVTGQWYHAAVTYDGSSWRLYLNGILETELYVGLPPRSDSIQHAALASALNSTGTASGFFNGVLDEARIWNYARTQTEIQTSINTEITMGQTGLVARWGLSEGSGVFVHGSAGTTVDGTIMGTGWAWAPGAPFNLVIDNPPAQPVVNAPPDDATSVALSPTLDVDVADADDDTLTVSFYGRPVSTASNPPFSLVIIPDTQYYSSSQNGGSPAIFRDQTSWIVETMDSLDLAFVAHVGDIVDHGDTYPAEWDSAWTAMALLEDPLTTGLAEGIPYLMTVGNHDQSPNGDATGTTTGFNNFFGVSHFSGRSYYGGNYGSNNDSHYALFSASGLDFIVVTMEYDTSPDAAVLAWADNLLATYPDRWAIVSAHLLLGTGNPGSFSAQGQAVYDALKDNPNLFLMVSGHNPGEGRRSDTYNGRVVHTVMADYQSRTNGGNGWLRVMKFYPDDNVVRVKTYSPWLDQFEADADSSSQFTLPIDLEPAGDWQLIGTATGVVSGSNASVVWPGRSPLTEYEWYVTVSDGHSTMTGPIWSFTTGSEPPLVTVIYPNGGETLTTGQSTNLQWTATDDLGVTTVDLLLSRSGVDGPYESIAAGIANTGSHPWTITGPMTTNAFLKAVARDAQGQVTADLSDASFTIYDPTIPVFIQQFDVRALEAGVELTWDVRSDGEVAGFKVYRAADGGEFELLNTEWMIERAERQYVDRTVKGGTTYDYQLGVVLVDATEARSQSVKVETRALELSLNQNHPNPFNPTTTVSFVLPDRSQVKLSIFDVTGRHIRALADGALDAGVHQYVWDGRDDRGGQVSTGVYFYRLETKEKTLTRKMLMLK